MHYIKQSIFLLIILSFFTLSCGEDAMLQPIEMKIKSVSGTADNFTGLKSFKINVEGEGVTTASACSVYPDTKEVGFKLEKSGVYTFTFMGYDSAGCASTSIYGGVAKDININIDDVNKVTIAIGKTNDFTLSSVRLHEPIAFAQASLLNEEIILSGGASNTSKFLKRSKMVATCEEGATDCFCYPNGSGASGCRKIIALDECTSQGMGSEQCTKCLEGQVKNDAFDFNVNTAECKINNCPINAEGYGCNLNGKNLIQKVDLNNLSTDLVFSENGTILKLGSNRIFHQSVYANNKVFILGGAPEGMISKNKPYISYIKAGQRKVADIFDGKTVLSKINTQDIHVGFNVIKTDDQIFMLNGKTSRGDVDADNVYRGVIKCSDSNCDDLGDMNDFPVVGGTLVKATGANDETTYAVLGGVSPDENYQGMIRYTVGQTTVQAENADDDSYLAFKNIYNSIGVFLTDYVLFLGFNAVSDDEGFVDAIGEGVDNFKFPKTKGTIFANQIPYRHKGKDGVLVIGGLKKNDVGEFKAQGIVHFISTDNNLLGGETPVTTLKQARFGASVVVDKNDRIWVMGGMIENEDGVFEVTDSIEVYTPATAEN